MFETINFDLSIKYLKIKWQDSSFFSTYIFAMFPIIWLCVPVVRVINDGSFEALMNAPVLYRLSFPIALGLFFITFYWIKHNERLVEHPYNGSAIDLRRLMEMKLKQDGWKICRSNPKFITAHRHGTWFVGSKLAILFYQQSILINVQNLGGRGYFPFSFGRNKWLTNRIISHIKNIPNP